MNDGVRVSATTTSMSIEDIRRALEGYVGNRLNILYDRNKDTMIATEDHFYEFFVRVYVDGSVTLYDEDDRFSSYEECVSKETRGCAIVERLANDYGSFHVKIECFGDCTLHGVEGGSKEYTAYSEEQVAILEEVSR